MSDLLERLYHAVIAARISIRHVAVRHGCFSVAFEDGQEIGRRGDRGRDTRSTATRMRWSGKAPICLQPVRSLGGRRRPEDVKGGNGSPRTAQGIAEKLPKASEHRLNAKAVSDESGRR